MRIGNHEGANWRWNVLTKGTSGTARSIEHAMLAVLMDIRTELAAITSRLDCSETVGIPRTLRRIAANTAKPKRKQVKR